MHRLVVGLARFMAIAGGLILLGLVTMTCISVIGRIINTVGHSAFLKEHLSFLASIAQNFGPILGDFEIVEAGMAFAIMAFLPWCQLNRGHAKVDVLAQQLPSKLERALSLCWELIFAFVIALLAWRLVIGTGDKMRYGETTFLLQFPIWWAYAASSAAAIVAALVAIYSVWLHFSDFAGGEQVKPTEERAGS